MNSEPRTALCNALSKIVASESLLTEPEELTPYECDGLTALREVPLAVVLPENLDQLRAIVALCNQMQVAVVTRGAGTGLSGGARPSKDALLIGLAKLNRILKINSDRKSITVEPGVTNLAISQAVSHLNLYYAPDPSSQIACTIGGNVAENAGGVHCIKYGLTVNNVLQVRMLTIDGELLTFGSESLDTTGYDLLSLVVGSEGLLGIVTEVTVRLLDRPPEVRLLLAAFDQIEVAGDAVGAILTAGITPAGLEMMDHRSIQAAEDFTHAGYPREAAAILLCELDGRSPESVAEQAIKSIEILKQCGATQVIEAKSEAHRNQLWAGRKGAFPAIGRISPDYYVMDGTIPRRHLGTVLQQIDQLSNEFGLEVANVFHAGDGNLHPLILYDANQPGELQKAEQMGTEILKHCIEAGGSITGEHGVGLEKLDAMCSQFNESELSLFHQLKQVFDPHNLLNPGKAIPTLHRCAELGAMHVHHGQLPHPELERF
ncbi:MAG: FAD-binding protein [Gammaproteobacteria bacterium]|jgi:glycolate oxidase|nr:FAD-binding protein [Gammaproteobacteria bacterium]MBT3489313.1 FAD-binding protein [Gammaproteobacteria bacterium]MBT3718693.1 FAD-binding protein [Gammaproteobacteria bacterium]MBT3843789.1 FAD-binding protein [Gammaproteobacteria bacterium]MBT3893985.1 FAD-binding protein [Gammaproteobacteria bacterium]